MHRLQSTADIEARAARLTDAEIPIVESDPYAEGYAEGYAAAMRERAVLRVRAVVEPPAPPIEADPYADIYAAGRLDERAAVVAYLREAAVTADEFDVVADAIAKEADAIERGEHRTGITPAAPEEADAGVITDPAQIRAYYRGASDALQAVLQHRAGGEE